MIDEIVEAVALRMRRKYGATPDRTWDELLPVERDSWRKSATELLGVALDRAAELDEARLRERAKHVSDPEEWLLEAAMLANVRTESVQRQLAQAQQMVRHLESKVAR